MVFYLTTGVCEIFTYGVHVLVGDVNVIVDLGDELAIFIDHSFEFGLENKIMEQKLHKYTIHGVNIKLKSPFHE
jgi:hypothetical protein